MFISLFLSLGFLISLGILNMGEAMGDTSPAMAKALDKLRPIKEQIGFWGVIYGLISLFATLISFVSPISFLIGLFGSLFIVVLSLPYGFVKFKKFFTIENPVILEEVESIISKVTSKQKILGAVSLGIAAALFLTAFGGGRY